MDKRPTSDQNEGLDDCLGPWAGWDACAAPQCQILSPTWRHEDQIKQATLSKKNEKIKSLRAEAAFLYVEWSDLDMFVRAYLM